MRCLLPPTSLRHALRFRQSLRLRTHSIPSRSLFRAVRSFSTANPQTSPNVKSYSEEWTSVRVSDEDDGEVFTCDEEPHMLKPEQGYGYYPLLLGQQLADGKLEIVRKLGWAGYSSVWLARTHKNAYPAEYVAVKVLTVNATAGVLYDKLNEENSLKAVKKANPNHPGYKHCLLLHDSFIAQSYHGPHLCFVTDVLGCNMVALRGLQANGRSFPVGLAKRIIKQTLLALDYLHRECNLVHTDVKPDNVLVSVVQTDEAIRRLLEESPSASYEPRIEPELSPDPIITVKSQPLPGPNLADMSDLSVCLIDYGHSTPVGKIPESGVQPLLLRAPEVILGHPWSTPIDIWSVGCLVFEYLIGTALFRLYESPSQSISFEDSHLQRTLEIIGPFPSSFLDACPRRSEFFDQEGSLIRIKKLSPRPIEDCMRIYNVLNEEDIPAAAAFARRCLTVDPGARPSALELLDDEWLRDV
ncbi:kinase-like domain-containing protein [Hygrophoropsis aurantiaca]|uniref:Kinase-like domain-containing protein n=1 Tax=Hygrophoropsis aurantiaca TaxID=72124 RepID=A0ACB8AAC1_9AGAM|nr:kinase-like domain-containing protein [Hygrophoropsis aurantiaca]